MGGGKRGKRGKAKTDVDAVESERHRPTDHELDEDDIGDEIDVFHRDREWPCTDRPTFSSTRLNPALIHFHAHLLVLFSSLYNLARVIYFLSQPTTSCRTTRDCVFVR